MSGNNRIKTSYFSVLLIMLFLACMQPSHAATPSSPTLHSTAVSGIESGGADRPQACGNRSKGVTEEYFDCMNRSLGAIEKAACISDEEHRQNARLNNNYRELLGILSGDRRRRLIYAQREWVVLREKDAFFEASLFENTQIENIAGSQREMLYTSDRANLIQEWLDMAKVD